MQGRNTPFDRLLVANRGEIACRVMRTARAMGHGTVAVHTEVDAHARHARQADLAICIGAPAAYLDIAAMIDAARRSGAGAVHPGYGFLAENAAFARACAEAGLVFVGPPAACIALMGDKARAKAAMAAAGVPCIPGYDGASQEEEVLLAEARRIGFPLMIKACAGGGGRGLRRVAGADDFLPALRSARAEAVSAFGDGRVLLERAIAAPHHVEVQVVADRHGNVIHLGERECSVQRRHQKLLEESPSPIVSPELRERMTQAAVAATRAIGYEGVGTLEFLVEPGGAFWFMEMNTRLQVEHCVTEAVTGLDLVELQLRIAAGERLPLRQEQVRLQGHAMEARLCAEDPAAGFAPCSGTVSLWRPGTHARVETALETGGAMPPDYDSLAAKFIAHGPDRAQARRLLAAALDESRCTGLRTNREYLAAMLRHPVFVAGHASTAFVEDHGAEVLAAIAPEQQRLQALAAAVWLAGDAAAGDPLSRLRHGPHALALLVDGAPFRASVDVIDSRRVRVRTAASAWDFEWLARDGDDLRVAWEGVGRAVTCVRAATELWLQSAHATVRASSLLAATGTRDPARGAIAGSVQAGMNGRIISLTVKAGDAVSPGQLLFAVEAMKMEHRHDAAAEGTVAAVHAAVGDLVKAGQVVVDIVPVPATPSPPEQGASMRR